MRITGERKRNSIRGQLIWTFTILLILAMFLFGSLATVLFKRALTENTGEYVSQIIRGLNRSNERYITNMEDIASLVLYQEDIKAFTRLPVDELTTHRINEVLNSVIQIRQDIVSIILIMDDGRFISDDGQDELNTNSAFREEEWFLRTESDKESHYISSSHVQNIIKGEHPWVISLIRPLTVDGKIKGRLLVDLNFDTIREQARFLEIGERGYAFIVNKRGGIVYHPRLDLIYNNLKHEKIDEILSSDEGRFLTEVDGEKVMYLFNRSWVTGWTTVGVAYQEELFQSTKELQLYLWILVILTFIVITYLSFLTSARITKPIEVLRESMQRVEQGDFDFEISIDCDHEVYDLAMDCQIAIKKIRELLIQSRKDQEQQREKELMVLQSQINPHFLYNTLDSIIWLTESGKGDDAVLMTEKLAQFFRLSLSKGKEIITVRRVMEHLDCYLTIQKMRYKNTLDYRILVDPDIYEYYTLKLLLQPLVENSIYHGLKEQNGIGHIIITGEKQGDYLHFSIKDDGAGMEAEKLELLRRGKVPASSRSGVGLGNVFERARLFWGDKVTMSFTSIPGNGMEVCLNVPLIEEKI